MLKWLDNFWYHNKWKVIISLFFIVVVVICTVQLATRKNYDACIVLIGYGGDVGKMEYNDIVSSLEKSAVDANGDGEVVVNFSRETYLKVNEELSSSLNANIVSFMTTVRVSDYFVFFIDPELYERYKNDGMFVTLEDKVGDIPKEMMYDEYAIRLEKCKFYDMPGMSYVQSDALIVLKAVPTSLGGQKIVSMEASQNAHAQLIKNIISYGVRK